MRNRDTKAISTWRACFGGLHIRSVVRFSVTVILLWLQPLDILAYIGHYAKWQTLLGAGNTYCDS